MFGNFHRILNRMTLFIGFLSVVIILSFNAIARLSSHNPVLNGIILGVFLFGVIICFLSMFQLLPEYKWLHRFRKGENLSRDELPPLIFRPVAKMLFVAKMEGRNFISGQALHSLLDLIESRFEEQRDNIRYITNVLILLGLVGTFWGLINTVQSFKDMIANVSYNLDDTMDLFDVIKQSLEGPLSGMGVAFSSSFLGLLSSLVVGFLFLQLVSAQNSMFRELEEILSDKTVVGFEMADTSSTLISDSVQGTLNNLISSSVSLERALNNSREYMHFEQVKNENNLKEIVSSFNKTMVEVKQVLRQYSDLKPKLDKILKINDTGSKNVKQAVLQLNNSIKKMNVAVVSIVKDIKKKGGK